MPTYKILYHEAVWRTWEFKVETDDIDAVIPEMDLRHAEAHESGEVQLVGEGYSVDVPDEFELILPDGTISKFRWDQSGDLVWVLPDGTEEECTFDKDGHIMKS